MNASKVKIGREPAVVQYNPQGNVDPKERLTGAFELLTCRARELVIKGPARTGKSLAADFGIDH